jgi:hypothetical protein
MMEKGDLTSPENLTLDWKQAVCKIHPLQFPYTPYVCVCVCVCMCVCTVEYIPYKTSMSKWV